MTRELSLKAAEGTGRPLTCGTVGKCSGRNPHMQLTRLLQGAALALALGPSLLAVVDRNGDGLSDVWAALYHPTKGAAVDEDGDGFTNAQEALAGTDPLTAASRFAAVPLADPVGNLVLRWWGVWGKRYLVESSADLKTWSALPELHIGRGEELSALVRAAGAAPESRRYWRVVVTDVDTDADGMTNAEESELGSDPTTPDDTLGAPRVFGAEYFVSPTGSDANTGTKVAPFLTLEKAKAVVRARIAAGVPAGGIVVWLRGGVYERTATLELTAADSGADASRPVEWRGYPGESVRVVGGRHLDGSGFQPVTSASPVWNRLDASARGKVLQLDLRARGISDYGALNVRGFAIATGAAMEVAVDGKVLPLARWPDEGETQLLQSEEGETFQLFGTTTPDVSGSYTRVGTTDGVSLFMRDALAGGQQYYLYRWTGVTNGNPFRYWFVSTQKSGWPSGKTPFWGCRYVPGVLKPNAGSGAAGMATGLDPLRLNHGFAYYGASLGSAKFAYLGDRPARWSGATDIWVAGNWGNLWAEYHLPVAGVDATERTIVLAKGPPNYGMVSGQPWYAYNLLEEITRPGEWYLDRGSGILYLWPPAGFGAASDVTLSVVDGSIFKLTNTIHWAVRDMTLEASRQNCINASDADGLQLTRLVLRNSGTSGAQLIGRNVLVGRCRVTGVGHSAITVEGGDRAELMSSGNRIEDCEVSAFARFSRTGNTGILIRGCGATIRNNRIHHAPQSAINLAGAKMTSPLGWGSNNSTVELNDIHDVCLTTADAGAIYAGRDWGTRGNVVKNNFIHRLHSVFGLDVNGIYLDDAVSGIRAEGNIIYDVTGAGLKAGGGRDNKLEHNLIVGCGNALYADSRALEWQKPVDGFPNNTPGDDGNLLEKLVLLGYQGKTWAKAYPDCARIPNDWAVVSDQSNRWLWPEGTVFSRNVCWDNFRLIEASSGTTGRMQEIAENLVDVDPLFVDEAAGDLNLQAGSPVRAIPGWQEIPFDRIGVRE